MSDTEPTVELPGAAADEALPDLERLAVIERELDDVSRALERLDDGSYGSCEVCSAAIPDDVLADAPAARRCADHVAGGSSTSSS